MERFRVPCYHETKTKNLVWSTYLPSGTPGGVQKAGARQDPSRQAEAPELPWAPPPQRQDADTGPGKQLELGGPGRGPVPGRGVVGPPANAPSHINPGGSSFSVDHSVVSRASHGCPPQHTAQARSTAPIMEVSTPDRGASGVQPISHTLLQGPCPLLTIQVVSL